MIANAIARNTGRVSEAIARALTWGADEKVLLAFAAVGWLASRERGEPLRRAGNHALLVTVMASLLPHALKTVFNQTRPDRMTILGHIHGVPFSGKREDAFPPATRCTWVRSYRPPAHCLCIFALRSGRLPSASR
jgi:hypothetical protein